MSGFSGPLRQRGDAHVLPELGKTANRRSLSQFVAKLFADFTRCQHAFAFEQLPDFDGQRRHFAGTGAGRRLFPVTVSLQGSKLRQGRGDDEEVGLFARSTEKIERHDETLGNQADKVVVCLLNRIGGWRCGGVP